MDHLNFVYWPWGRRASENCLSKCNNEIDLQFFNIDKSSNYKPLLNVTELALRFIDNLKKSLNQKGSYTKVHKN